MVHGFATSLAGHARDSLETAASAERHEGGSRSAWGRLPARRARTGLAGNSLFCTRRQNVEFEFPKSRECKVLVYRCTCHSAAFAYQLVS